MALATMTGDGTRWGYRPGLINHHTTNHHQRAHWRETANQRRARDRIGRTDGEIHAPAGKCLKIATDVTLQVNMKCIQRRISSENALPLVVLCFFWWVSFKL